MESAVAQWCNLPIDLLETVAKRLDGDTDYLRFICNSWRSYILPVNNKSFTQFSINFIQKSDFPRASELKCCGDYTIVESRIYHLLPRNSSNSDNDLKGWLVRIGEQKGSQKLRLMHPITGLPVCFQNVINSLNLRVTLVVKAYNLYGLGVRTLGKFVLSSDYSVMGLIQEKKLFYMRLVDNKWTRIDNKHDKNDNDGDVEYRDIVYHKRHFYAAVDYGYRMGKVNTVVFNSCGLKVGVIATPPMTNGVDERWFLIGRRLMVSSGDIFLLQMYQQMYQHGFRWRYFKVYKLMKKEWVRVKSLGNEAGFWGNDLTFAISTPELFGYKQSCIYSSRINRSPNNDALLHVYNLVDSTEKEISSQNFWPPPTWLR